MNSWPRVLDEYSTLDVLYNGQSIARFGDGELKCAFSAGYRREPPNRRLATELKNILQGAKCLVGIPTMDKSGPKYASWTRHQKRYLELLNPKIVYFSAFISRPDSAPWINTTKFAHTLVDIWRGKRVAVLCEPTNSLFQLVQRTAGTFYQFSCPSHEAYQHIKKYQKAIAEVQPDVAVLSAGPTATCLAARLAEEGIQALDLGSAGGWLSKLV